MKLSQFNQAILQIIIDRLVEAAHPIKIILFGSAARNDFQEDSDLDLIIVEKEVKNKGQEMVRLRNAIGNVGIGVDVLVYSEKEIKDWGHLPGSALYSGLKEGKTIYEAS